MIENDLQYEVTEAAAGQFEAALRTALSPLEHRAALAQLLDLQREMTAYRKAAHGWPRIGDAIVTFTGGLWWPHDPRPWDVRLGDQLALVQVVRFGGACRQPDGEPAFYAVMQHEVLVADLVGALGGSREEQRAALFHDGHEVYPPGDVLSPVWNHDSEASRGLKAMSAAARGAFRTALRLPAESPAVVRHADAVLLATEARDLMPNPAWWAGRALPPPLKERVVPWPADYAVDRFRKLAMDLHGEAP